MSVVWLIIIDVCGYTERKKRKAECKKNKIKDRAIDKSFSILRTSYKVIKLFLK